MTKTALGRIVRKSALFLPFTALLMCSTAAMAEPMRFLRTLLNTGGKTPELCLRFADALDSQAGPHYADHVQITPGLRPDIRISDHDLCLGGLSWSTRYRITISNGIHDANGRILAQPVTVSMATGDRKPT